jgi:hypothetical protein
MRPLGMGVREWGLRKESEFFKPYKRWEEELERETELEAIHK